MPELIETARSYGRGDIYPFHMPGHKRNEKFIPNDLLDLDITEIDGADNLHDARTVIKEAQEFAAELWRADESFFLVNGSSCGVMAALMSVCKDGDAVLAARNSHVSFYNGLSVSGARPVYISPKYLPCGLAGGIRPEDVEAELKKDKRIKAVFVTSPTYEGFVSDIARIAETAHRYGKLLIVDEAHGAHFIFSEYFPESAIRLGADIVIQSLHKTLPALGQSAILHVKRGRADMYELRQSLFITQTTSPSYILMSVMQNIIYRLSEDSEAFNEYVVRLKDFREAVKGLKNLRLIDAGVCGEAGIYGVDLGKLVFLVDNGVRVDELLRERYKIQVEASGYNHFIALTSVADIKEGFERLKYALKGIDKNLTGVGMGNGFVPANVPEMVLTPREARSRKKSMIYLSEASGRISAEHIAPYPPGVPILAAGEKITDEIIRLLQQGIKKEYIYVAEDSL